MFDRADLLANLTIYWATATIGSSMRLYYETAHSTAAAYGRVEVPTGLAMSGADMFPTPAHGPNGSTTWCTGPTCPVAGTSWNGKSPS